MCVFIYIYLLQPGSTYPTFRKELYSCLSLSFLDLSPMETGGLFIAFLHFSSISDLPCFSFPDFSWRLVGVEFLSLLPDKLSVKICLLVTFSVPWLVIHPISSVFDQLTFWTLSFILLHHIYHVTFLRFLYEAIFGCLTLKKLS